jgi:hypothetical protein
VTPVTQEGFVIIGAPKAVQDFPKLKKEEVEALAATLVQLLAQGAEPGMPMGVPLGSLGQLVHTALGAFESAEEVLPTPVIPVENDRPRLILPE